MKLNPKFFRRCSVLSLMVIASLPVAHSLGETMPALRLTIAPPGISNEFSATPQLDWNSASSASYVVQTTTNIADAASWSAVDLVSSAAGSVHWTAPESLGTTKFYRLVTQPTVYDAQPAFINSGDTNAVLYLFGQMLPSNAIVSINGHNFGMTHDSTGNSGDVWRVSLNGLPPGEPVIGTLTVMDANSNVIATVPVQSSIYYGDTAPVEQLQGPAEEPPASPAKKEFKGHVTLLKAFDDDAGENLIAAYLSKKGYDYYKAQSELSARGHTKSGHVTLLKAFDDGSESESAARGLPITIKPPPHAPSAFRGGHVTLMKAFDDGEDALAARRLPVRNLGSSGQDGVDLATGEMRLTETDFAIPGLAMDFQWTRTYRSRTGPTTTQGADWDFSYNVSLTQNSDGTVTLHPGNGRADTFYPAGTNGWFRDEYFCQIIDLNGDGFPDVLFADTSRWLFNPLGTAAGGKLAQIIDRNGNAISLGYDSKGRLTQIVDDLGRTNTVAYSAKNQIASLTDFSGRSVRYEYDGAGNLISVISPPVTGTPTGDDFPNGITNRYTYTSGNADDQLNHNLAACVDGAGQTWLQINYQPTTDPMSVDYDRVDSVLTYKSGGVVCSTSHLRCFPQTPSSTNHFAVLKAVCHDGAGNVSEYFYDSRNRCVRELDDTGRCDPSLPVTETGNRPTGKLRSDDPDYFESQWTWNVDSLCTSETLPDGEVTEYTYQRAFNQNSSRTNRGQSLGPIDDSLHNGDLRVARLRAVPGGGGDLDGDGVPDITELAWHFNYDPRFGSPAPDTSAVKIRHRGWDGLIYGTHRIAGGGDELPQESLSASSEKIRHRGWDGLIYGTHRKGWDGTVKGLMAMPDEAAFSSDGRKGWDGTVKIPSAATLRESPTLTHIRFGDIKSNARLRESPTLSHIRFGGGSSAAVKWSRDSLKGSTKTQGDFNLAHRFSVEIDSVTAVTDPRGNVTTASYDAKGNCLVIQHSGYLLDANDAPISNFAYNNHGQLTAITNAPDANGQRRVDKIVYYSSGAQAGQVQSIAIDESGVHIAGSFEYDATGNLTRYVDPRTNDWLFTYNALDQCVRVQTPTNILARCTATFGHDANGNCTTDIVEYKDGEDGTTHTRPGRRYFDALNRCVASVDQVLPGTLITNRFDYDANDQLIAAYSPMAVSGADSHAVVSYQYDERGLLFREIGPDLNGNAPTNEYAYHLNGMRTRINELEAKLTKIGLLTYDGFGQPVSCTDPMGNVCRYTYDRNGNCTMARCYGETNDVPGSAGNVLLAQTQYTYDSLDRCIQVRDAFGNPTTQSSIGKGVAVTTYTYSPDGDCTSVTDDNGHTTSYTYDTAGRPATVTSPAARSTTTYTYDPNGNVTGTLLTDQPDGGGAAQQFSLSYTYDSRDRCVAASDNVGNTNRYVYDSFSRCVQATSPNGVHHWFTYDDLGRCTVRAADLNRDGALDFTVDSWTSYVYDDNSRCVASSDGNTNWTYYSYDSAGDCIRVMNTDGSVLKLIWSPRSNLLSTEDATGSTVTNTYDACDRIVHRDIAARNVLRTTTTFENFAYDGCSRCVSAANDSSTSTFAYDSLGDCLGTTQDGLTTTYTYDGVGNNLSATYPSGRVVTYTYNEVDDVSSVSSSASGGLPPTTLATYNYAGPGRTKTITRANGVSTTLQWDGTLNPANATGDYGWMQPRGISHATSGGAIDQRRCNFDRDQNRLSRTMIAPMLVNGLETNLFQYDGGNRLLHFADLNSSSVHLLDWSLDKLGNRLVETNDSTIGLYTMQSTIPPGDFEMNRYSTTPLVMNSYDANGNLQTSGTAMAPTFYAYDYANRLVEVSTMTSGGLSVIASYTYDALGRRISKTSMSTGLPATTYFVHGEECDDGNTESGDGCDVLEERILGSSNNRVYIYGGSGDYVVFSGTNPQYAQCDDLGNLLAVTDGSGIVLERYAYDAFGAPTFLTSDGTLKIGSDGLAAKVSDFGMSRLFRGMEWDDETGFYFEKGWPCRYEGPRAFDPVSGRCLTRAVRCADGSCSAYDPLGGNPWSPPVAYKIKALSADGGKKEYVGHVSLMK